MKTAQFDVAIIGGGHNGLTAAAYLAGAGHSVVVLEKNDRVGGAALTEEFAPATAPGYRNSVASYTVSLLNPKVIADLELARHGLQIVHRPAGNFWPLGPGRSLALPYGDIATKQKALATLSPADAARLPAYDAALERAADVLRDLVTRTPPNAGGGLLELIKGGAIGRRMLKLDIAEQRRLVDLFTSSASDFLAKWFEHETVKAAFAYDGIVGSDAAPSTPGTAYVLLHHCFGEVNGKRGVWGHAIGGMGAITQAMARAAEARGAVLRTNAAVARVVVENGRARGVELANGDIVTARIIAANVPPKLLFRDLIAASETSADMRAAFLGMKTGSAVFRMNVALSELPDFVASPGPGLKPHHASGIMIAPTLDYMEQAYIDARTLGWSRAPVIEMLIPSTLDGTLAPTGGHVASLFVQYVAPHLPGTRSWSDPAEAARFADVVIDTVTTHAPNFKASIIGRQTLSPLDLERRFGLIDGDIFHGQLTLGQLFSARPVLGAANYRLPIAGLYLCGSGAHPGGGVTGVPGMNAAREMAKDLKSLRLRS
ncbi:MAG: phytoene desaturase family protein [Hyphomicrobium sp.]